jgi:hypothetical protein
VCHRETAAYGSRASLTLARDDRKQGPRMSLSAFAPYSASADSNPPKLAKRAEAGRSIRATNLAQAEHEGGKRGRQKARARASPETRAICRKAI